MAVTEAAVHVVDSAFGVATVSPAGSESVNAAVRFVAALLPLPRLSVSVEVVPEAIEVGAKDLLIVGAAALTVRLALAGAALLPCPVARAPAARVLVAAPGVIDVTATLMLQPPAGRVAPLA